MPPAYVKPYIRRQKNDVRRTRRRSARRLCGLRCGLSACARSKTRRRLCDIRRREMLISQRTQLLSATARPLD